MIKMKKIFQAIRYLGVATWGVGAGMMLSSYLVRQKHWEWFPLHFVGLFVLLLAPTLWHFRTRQQQKERKEKAIKRYERLTDKFGENNLQRISTIGWIIVLSGFLAMLLPVFISRLDQNQAIYPIALLVLAVGICIAAFFSHPTKIVFTLGKKKS